MFKFKYAKQEDIPQDQKGFYTQGSDGVWYLQVEGAVDKARLDEFRDNNIRLQGELDKFKDIDPTKVKDLMAREQKIMDGKLMETGKVDELVTQRTAAMKSDFESQINTLNGRLETANRQLETLVVDNAVREQATKLGVQPSAVDDVLLRAKTVFKVEDGRPVAKDAKGDMIYGKDGQTSLGIGDWIGTLKDTAPHLFLGSTGSNSNNNGRRDGGQHGANLNPTQKIAAGLQAGSDYAH
jgi:hypothetical protein